MAYTARVRKSYELLGVNVKTATSTLIVPAQSGRKFIPRGAFARIATRTGSGAEPMVDFEVVGAADHTGNPITHNLSLGATKAVGELVEIALDGTSEPMPVNIGTTGISVSVLDASTYTTHTMDFYIEGYLI